MDENRNFDLILYVGCIGKVLDQSINLYYSRGKTVIHFRADMKPVEGLVEVRIKILI